MSEIQILLLAAGASRRMGAPKQLLSWGKETLIESQLKKLLATKQKVAVVLGANAEKITPLIDKLPVKIFVNPQWKEGMGYSIAYGLKCLLENEPQIDGVLIALIDQPLLSTTYFNEMLDEFQTGSAQILVSKSDKGWSGAPVLFDQIYFMELLELKGDEGAKKVAKNHGQAIKYNNGGDMLRDMDTMEAYQRLLTAYERT